MTRQQKQDRLMEIARQRLAMHPMAYDRFMCERLVSMSICDESLLMDDTQMSMLSAYFPANYVREFDRRAVDYVDKWAAKNLQQTAPQIDPLWPAPSDSRPPLLRLKAADTKATPAPVVTASDGPAPLTTNEIANCFAGLREWDVERWKDELGSPDGWLKDCQHRPGTRGRGGYQSTWFPVLIGAALVERFAVPAKSVSSIFKRMEPLAQWRDAWELNDPDSY